MRSAVEHVALEGFDSFFSKLNSKTVTLETFSSEFFTNAVFVFHDRSSRRNQVLFKAVSSCFNVSSNHNVVRQRPHRSKLRLSPSVVLKLPPPQPSQRSWGEYPSICWCLPAEEASPGILERSVIISGPCLRHSVGWRRPTSRCCHSANWIWKDFRGLKTLALTVM